MKVTEITAHAKQRFFDRAKYDFEERIKRAVRRNIEVIPNDFAFKFINNKCKNNKYFRDDEMVYAVAEDGAVITVLKWDKRNFRYKYRW